MKNTPFIKAANVYKKEYSVVEPAPRFRRKFSVSRGLQKAMLSVCGLGFGEYHLNGNLVTKDKFIAPYSDYNKTLWYTSYDVTKLINEGENIATAYLGFGFFNENHKTAWDHNEAPWRDNPKFVYKLMLQYGDRVEYLLSDDKWKCSIDGYIRYSQLRSGEYCDLRLLDDWTSINYDDSSWENAIIDDRSPTGVFRECTCQPMRECELFPTKNITKTGENKYVFDIGQNISGYPKIKVKGTSGDKITIRYSERFQNNELCLEGVDFLNFEAPYGQDRLILSGEEVTWSPKFVFHGFRYIEIDGLKEEPNLDTLTGVFLRHTFEPKTEFKCSNEKLNRLYKMGQYSVKSNFFYMPTDCPTREKYGWANDARASAENFLLNFDTEQILEKWMQDIIDSVREDGNVPGIIPSHGWGYEWGSGPISSGALFELPYREYLINGNSKWLTDNIESFIKHLDFLKSKANDKGLIGIGLCDWAGPYETAESSPVPVTLSDTALYINFLDITALAMKIKGDAREKEILCERQRIAGIFKNTFIDASGRCTVSEQSALALIIDFNIYDNLEPLKKQLIAEVEKHNYHHYCGMLGLRHLFYALCKIDKSDYVYKILTSTGFPSYMEWIDERDCTTLCEVWKKDSSYNHHMWSFFMAWLVTEVGGIKVHENNKPLETLVIEPNFVEGFENCETFHNFKGERYTVSWQRTGDIIEISVRVPKDRSAILRLPNNDEQVVIGDNEVKVYSV